MNLKLTEMGKNMKILGISGSPRGEKTSNCFRLVKKVLEATGMDYELISLRGKKINGCIACLGCVKDNVCVVQDDMAPMREKFLEADAFVIGAPNYYTTINGLTQCLLERWFQFRHRTGNALWGKLAVGVGVGGSAGQVCADKIEEFMAYNFIETVAKVSGQGAASCFSCGYGESCEVGLPAMVYGKGVQITEDMIPDIEKQPDVVAEAEKAGKMLAERLANHDRKAVTDKMMQQMMEHFRSSM